MKSKRRVMGGAAIVVLGCLFAAVISGCANMKPERHHATSVMDYLYPKESDHIDKPGVTNLSLPIRVAIAFVPASRDRRFATPMLTAAQQTELLTKVADHFKKYDYVKSIEVIPSAYLTPGGSFTNLDQIRSMYGVDVIALASLDQTQFTDEGMFSLTYLTVVGAFVVPGEKNATHTMVDVAVYDIASRKLLFRAPGISFIKGLATPVNLREQLRGDSSAGFTAATDQMIVNLDDQLKSFKDKVKNAPSDYKVTHQPGYSGGGDVDPLFLLILAVLAGLGWRTCRRKPLPR